jgi:hypothetical protein
MYKKTNGLCKRKQRTSLVGQPGADEVIENRQHKPGCWVDVFERVAADLEGIEQQCRRSDR